MLGNKRIIPGEIFTCEVTGGEVSGEIVSCVFSNGEISGAVRTVAFLSHVHGRLPLAAQAL